ncbi:MAG: hypothetical protein HQ557_06915 [Bacteroidetes bacterium]|nr:hypothetical protein [Bacteroidota bacterium]
MNKKPFIVNSLKVLIALLIAVWGVVGSYRVITSEIMNYSIFNQEGSVSLINWADTHENESESTEHDAAVFVGRGRGGVGRGGGAGGRAGGGGQFFIAPDAFNRYVNYAGMFALIILIVYWLQKYTAFRKKAKKQIVNTCS